MLPATTEWTCVQLIARPRQVVTKYGSLRPGRLSRAIRHTLPHREFLTKEQDFVFSKLPWQSARPSLNIRKLFLSFRLRVTLTNKPLPLIPSESPTRS